MIEIITKIVINASPREVWRVVSEIDNDPQFWKGTVKVRNTSRDRNEFTREVILRNSDKCYQKIILFPIDGIHIRWTKGTINGIKDIIINSTGQQTVLQVEMNYKINGVASLFSRDVSEDLLSEAELALQWIKEEAEKNQFFLLDQKVIWGCIHA